ncbi:transposase [Paraburkholderia sp. 22098]|uniref:transposase n=1 Tax=Paraburkholderia sp. 22098 TaxID=3453874 RepID=UPI003F83ECD2
MFFDELSNDEWALLSALVSDEPAVRLNRRGRPRADPRVVANAVLWILTTGEPWSKLPGRYPSGPTCRRRFEEWQLNGTLLEMVRLLSRTGRTFAYVPQPAPLVAAKPAGKPAAQVAETSRSRDDAPRGVTWKSPESWQAPGTSRNGANALHAALPSHARDWRCADPFADITRQLAGIDNVAPTEQSAPHTPYLPPAVGRAPAFPTPSVAYAPRPALRVDLGAIGEAGAVGAAMQGLDSAIASARKMPAAALQRSPLPASLAPRGRQVAERHGYLIYVAAERVPNDMYRAWAEIMMDGRRVERSGLVGPRFADPQAAEQYAFEWAAQWVDRECRTLAAAQAAPQARAPQQHATTMQTHKPGYAPNGPATHAPYAGAPARPLPGLRHVPEPVAAHHGAPLHGPLNAFRGPLRRYASEPSAVTTSVPANIANAVNAVNAADAAAHVVTEREAAERYPSYTELISHAG